MDSKLKSYHLLQLHLLNQATLHSKIAMRKSFQKILALPRRTTLMQPRNSLKKTDLISLNSLRMSSIAKVSAKSHYSMLQRISICNQKMNASTQSARKLVVDSSPLVLFQLSLPSFHVLHAAVHSHFAQSLMTMKKMIENAQEIMSHSKTD